MLFSSNRYPFLTIKVGSSEEIINPRTGGIRVVERAKEFTLKSGRLEVNDEESIISLLHHPSYNTDFYGPYSREEVKTGEYKKTLDRHIKKNPSDSIRPNVEQIAKEGEIKAPRVLVKSESLLPDQVMESVKIQVKDIMAREAEKNKDK